MTRRMAPGYCYEYVGNPNDHSDARHVEDEAWETAVYTPTSPTLQGETFLFIREIDGSPCAVFACPDGIFRAQLRIYCPEV